MNPLQTSVFISYAREDLSAAENMESALAKAGIQTWLDKQRLGPLDDWEKRIFAEIDRCALFIAIISATTKRRTKGYFRHEWHRARKVSHGCYDPCKFLVPVVIDDTAPTDSNTPEELLIPQWNPAPGGNPGTDFVERLRALLGLPAKVAPIVAEPQASVVNLALRGFVGPAEAAMVGGFVIAGNRQKGVMIRALGPSLMLQGIRDPLPDPVLELHDAIHGNQTIAIALPWTSYDQPTRDALKSVAYKIGAFPIPDNSRDAVLVVNLSPGVYSFIVGSASGKRGLALFELYQLPD